MLLFSFIINDTDLSHSQFIYAQKLKIRYIYFFDFIIFIILTYGFWAYTPDKEDKI